MSLLKTGILEELKLEGGLRFLKVGFIYWMLRNFLINFLILFNLICRQSQSRRLKKSPRFLMSSNSHRLNLIMQKGATRSFEAAIKENSNFQA